MTRITDTVLRQPAEPAVSVQTEDAAQVAVRRAAVSRPWWYKRADGRRVLVIPDRYDKTETEAALLRAGID